MLKVENRFQLIGLWVFLSITLVCVGMLFGCDAGAFVKNYRDQDAPVSAALNLRSCKILAKLDFEPNSKQTRDDYDRGLRQGTISLKSGTNVKQLGSLNYTGGHLVPSTPTGPMTSGESVERHIGVYAWMIPEGAYNGTEVCVSIAMRFGKYPPL